MSHNDNRSPDEELGAEAFEPPDEALDEASRINPNFIEEVEQDPLLDPALQVDERELEEVGADLDDPEGLVTLDEGVDDSDGVEALTRDKDANRADAEGWELDEPLTGKDVD